MIIIYDNIDEKIYKYKKLTITYELDSYCDVLMFYKNNKYLFIDMITNYEKFKKLINKSQYRTYKYLISNFKEIELELTSILKSKYYSLRILPRSNNNNLPLWIIQIKLEKVLISSYRIFIEDNI